MEPYKPNEPFIKLKLNGSLLDRMVEAGIPLSRALQYFRDNPEGSALETLKTAAEDVIPFYGNYRNGGDWSDYAKEAVLMATPMPRGYGKRYKVNTDINGVPDLNDLKKWGKDKSRQYDGFILSSPHKLLADTQRMLDMFNKNKKYMDPKSAARIEAQLRQTETKAALETLDESPYYDKVESWGLIPDNARLRGNVSRGKYIYDKLVDEYGPEDGTYYYHKLWQSDNEYYPHPQDMGIDHDLLERMYESIPNREIYHK